MRKYIVGVVFGVVLGSVGVAVSKPTTTSRQTGLPKAPVSKPAPTTPTATVPASTCAQEVAKVSLCTAEDPACGRMLAIPCHPYTCDKTAKICKAQCASDKDCAQGASCDTATAVCSPFGHECQDDYTVQDASGQVESCIPHKCVGGACLEHCSDSNDCYSGFKCNNEKQRCVKK